MQNHLIKDQYLVDGQVLSLVDRSDNGKAQLLNLLMPDGGLQHPQRQSLRLGSTWAAGAMATGGGNASPRLPMTQYPNRSQALKQ